MERTQLQLRIDASVRNNCSYPQNTHFIDLKGYREKSFVEEDEFKFFSLSFITDRDIKEGDSLEDIKPAVQARLALMDFGDNLVSHLNKYKNSNFLLKQYLKAKIVGIQVRNEYLMTKAVIKTIKRKGLASLISSNNDDLILSYILMNKKKSYER